MKRLSATQRWLPLGYLGAAIALTILILPSGLRPPPQAPPTSAQLSPDAPPDDQQVLLSELGQGQSATAGVGVGEVELPGDEPAGAVVPDVPPPARSGRCFGDPPRQTESLYAAPCAPAFVGDNGGATAKGVTENEVRIALVGSPAGPVRGEPSANDSAATRQLRVWEEYFNERYEFYGRQLRLFRINLPGTGPEADRAAVAAIDDEWPLFGFFAGVQHYPALEEAIRRKIIFQETAAAATPHWFYKKHSPYAFSLIIHVDKAMAITGELICKQFAGKPPEFNSRMDPTFDYSAPRKWGGLFYEEADGFREGREHFEREIAKCGETLTEYVSYNLYDEQSTLAASMTKLRAAGVTTILIWDNGLVPIAYMQEASNSGYYPEWIYNPEGSCGETNGCAQLWPKDQAQHVLLQQAGEIPRPPQHTDCYMAFRSQDPDEAPGQCPAYFAIQQFANGIQMAGPNLTPDTFWQGLQRIPCKPPVPEWSRGGCYGPDNFTYPEYVAFGWFDVTATAPENGSLGAYRYMHDGKRFKLGEIPTVSPWFQEGITTPDDPVQHY